MNASVLLLALLALGVAAPPPVGAGVVRVEVETALGLIEAELYPAQAPLTVANFLRYVDRGSYNNGARFHRTVRLDNQAENSIKIEVVQAGTNPDSEQLEFDPVVLERTSLTGLRHTDGTLSMARDTPDSASSDFFICIGPQPELDFAGRRNPDGQGFAAFGRVTRGMDVVRHIQQAPAAAQTLKPPVAIRRILRLP